MTAHGRRRLTGGDDSRAATVGRDGSGGNDGWRQNSSGGAAEMRRGARRVRLGGLDISRLQAGGKRRRRLGAFRNRGSGGRGAGDCGTAALAYVFCLVVLLAIIPATRVPKPVSVGECAGRWQCRHTSRRSLRCRASFSRFGCLLKRHLPRAAELISMCTGQRGWVGLGDRAVIRHAQGACACECKCAGS